MLCSIWNIPPGFATLVAGIFVIIAAAIAWRATQQQIRTTHNDIQQQISSVQKIEITKLRLELYNRRFEIFVSIFDFYEALIRWTGTPEQRAAQTRFFRAYQESGFLFSKESGIEDTLKRVHDESAKVIGFKEYGEDYKSGGVAFYLEQFKKAQHVLLVDFDTALVKLRVELPRYLNFHSIVDSD
jgi:hypothetical protein